MSVMIAHTLISGLTSKCKVFFGGVQLRSWSTVFVQ